MFTGERVDGTRDFQAAFGDYVVCTKPKTNNSMQSRTEDCIVLLPTGGRNGAVKMLSIETGKVVTRDQFRINPMPLSVIMRLNALAKAEGRTIGNKTDIFTELQYMQSVNMSNMPTFINNLPGQGLPETGIRLIPSPIPPPQLTGLADDIQNADDISNSIILPANGGVVESARAIRVDDDAANQGVPAEAPPIDLPEVPPPNPPAPARNGEPPAESVFVASQSPMKLTTSSVAAIENMLKQRRVTGEVSTTSNVSVREALRSRGDDAEKVIIKELRQMIDKKVWVPTMMSTLDSSQVKSIIRSSMFVKRIIRTVPLKSTKRD
jgi:hypothetical protein